MTYTPLICGHSPMSCRCVSHAPIYLLTLGAHAPRVIIKELKTLKNEQKVGMLLQKRTDTRGVGIRSDRKSIYLLTTTTTSHTHRFHPLSTIVIHTFYFAQIQSMDDNCGELVECMGVASGCGEQEEGVDSGSMWNLWVWLP